MTRRSIALLALAALATPACTMTATTKHTTTTAGGVIAAGGAIAVGMITSAAVEPGPDGEAHALGQGPALLLALAATALGIGLLVAGATADIEGEPATPFHDPELPISHDVASIDDPPASSATPASLANADIELPALPTSPAAIQLAGQVRSMARGGRCDAARATLAHLELVDVAYAHAVTNSAIMQPCM